MDTEQYDKVSVGYLTVFSSTEETQWGEGSYYYVHTGYRIYDSAGKVVKWVENHDTSIDEDPQKVELAPGTYTIWAQSDKDGYVKVPVVIKLARTTAVHLET
jgi:flagellar hook assembly protein FlgD